MIPSVGFLTVVVDELDFKSSKVRKILILASLSANVKKQVS